MLAATAERVINKAKIDRERMRDVAPLPYFSAGNLAERVQSCPKGRNDICRAVTI
jgi:hypothetical protein